MGTYHAASQREICILVIVLQRCFVKGTLDEVTFIDT